MKKIIHVVGAIIKNEQKEEQITQLISLIQDQTHKTVTSMDTVKNEVSEGMIVMTEAGKFKIIKVLMH